MDAPAKTEPDSPAADHERSAPEPWAVFVVVGSLWAIIFFACVLLDKRVLQFEDIVGWGIFLWFLIAGVLTTVWLVGCGARRIYRKLPFEIELELGAAPVPAPALSASAPTQRLVGRKYEIDHLIGKGGMGLIYAGRDLALDRLVAVKKMRPELKLNERDKKRFMREATLSASLHHPWIVVIYDIVEQDGELYLVFEFVDGKTMGERLDGGPISPGELMFALKFICLGLGYAHSMKVAHRDLKPSNIMLTRQGHAKVMDFGIAREIKDTASRLTKMDTSGTLPYMAPEQELGRFDVRSDIYALGVTLYEALTGELPFPGPNFTLQKERMEFKPLAESAPSAPGKLRAAIERCMRHDPQERFQTIAEFASAAGVDQTP